MLKLPISQLIARENKYQIELEAEKEKAKKKVDSEIDEEDPTEEHSRMVNDGKLWVDKYTS